MPRGESNDPEYRNRTNSFGADAVFSSRTTKPGTSSRGVLGLRRLPKFGAKNCLCVSKRVSIAGNQRPFLLFNALGCVERTITSRSVAFARQRKRLRRLAALKLGAIFSARVFSY